MRLSISILVFLFSIIQLLSTEIPFKYERMICDFHGVVSNDETIICYGDYGILTWSSNRGKTWEQSNIGDKYNIYKIVNRDNIFYGVTNHSIIISTNSGRDWINKEIFEGPDIIDMCFAQNMMYILTKRSILSCEFSLSPEPIKIIDLDTTINYSQFVSDDQYLFINANNEKIIKIDIEDYSLAEIAIDYKKFCPTCGYNFYLKSFDNILFILLQNYDINKIYPCKNSLWKTDNGTETWEKVSDSITYSNDFLCDNDKIFFLYPQKNAPESFTHSFYSIDITSGTIEQLNKNDTNSRYISYDYQEKEINFKELIRINGDTLIAVGNNKLISMSYDNGRTWSLQSFFNAYYMGLYASGNWHEPTFLSDSIIYLTHSTHYEIDKSTNAGVTWLPQRYLNFTHKGGSESFLNYYFDNTGKGFAKTFTIDTADQNVLSTYDFGETYFLDNDSIFHSSENSGFQYYQKNLKGIGIEDTILYFFRSIVKDSLQEPHSILFRYDNYNNFIDSIIIEVDFIKSIVVTKEKNIICLALKENGKNNPDSSGKAENYSYEYVLLKSTDKGRRWDSLAVELPFYKKLIHLNGDRYLFHDFVNNYARIIGNEIIFPASLYGNENNLLYLYDMSSNTFDSLVFNQTFNNFDKSIFKFRENNYLISNYNTLYFSNDLKAEPNDWDSIQVDKIFGQWDNIDPYEKAIGKEAILSSEMINDSFGYLIIGASQTFFTKFKMNFVKIQRLSNSTAVVEPFTEQERAYLWNKRPYPQPGKNIIKSEIYWNRNLSIDDAQIKVYDIFGAEKNMEVTINVLTDYSATISADFSKEQSGVYIIAISLNGERRAIPVMITR